ncbi:hypothetical protein J6590_034530 [Homalodisca vitripennis]|nr:hypothetical protein J6590_034530 [Homalodisca vitripennis]
MLVARRIVQRRLIPGDGRMKPPRCNKLDDPCDRVDCQLVVTDRVTDPWTCRNSRPSYHRTGHLRIVSLPID